MQNQKNLFLTVLVIFISLAMEAQPSSGDYCTYYEDVNYYPDYGVEYCAPLVDKGDRSVCNITDFCATDNTDYFGRTGGLYPGYANFPPSADYYEYFPDLSGESPVIMVGVGPSIPTSIFENLQGSILECQDVVLINAGIPSRDLYDANFNVDVKVSSGDREVADDADWNILGYETNFTPDNPLLINITSTTEVDYWDYVAFKVYSYSIYTPDDVDVLWAMQGLRGDHGEYGAFDVEPIDIDGSGATLHFNTTYYNSTYFDDYIDVFAGAYKDYLEDARTTFDETQVMYISDVPYAGYCYDAAFTPLMPPYDYWNGWGVKQVVEDYITDGLWWDADDSDPFVMWGPYMWRRGNNEACFDSYSFNFKWPCNRFNSGDGFHLSGTGKSEAAARANVFFRYFSWYHPHPACDAYTFLCPPQGKQTTEGYVADQKEIISTPQGIIISLPENFSSGVITIYNATGQMMLSEEIHESITVNQLQSGYYIYRITDSRGEIFDSGNFEIIE